MRRFFKTSILPLVAGYLWRHRKDIVQLIRSLRAKDEPAGPTHRSATEGPIQARRAS